MGKTITPVSQTKPLHHSALQRRPTQLHQPSESSDSEVEDNGSQTEMNNQAGNELLGEIKQLVQTVSVTSSSKRAPLDLFREDPDQDVELWIQDFKSRASACRWDEATTFNSITDNLAGPAKDWYRVTITDSLDSKNPINTSEEVFKLLKEYFLPEEHDEYLRESIQNMNRERKL